MPNTSSPCPISRRDRPVSHKRHKNTKGKTQAGRRKRGEGRSETGKRPLRIRTRMKGKTHTAGQSGDGIARVAERRGEAARADGRSGWARTGGGVDERGTHGWRSGEVRPHGRMGGAAR